MPRQEQETERKQKRTFLCVVDGCPEVKQAIYYAARRAKKVGANIMLLGIVAPASGGSEMMWGNVKNLVDNENHTQVKEAVDSFVDYVQDIVGTPPSIIIEEGTPTDIIKNTLKTHPEIRILVLGTSIGEDPGPLVKELTSGKTRLHIPITLVPGDISVEDIEMMSE